MKKTRIVLAALMSLVLGAAFAQTYSDLPNNYAGGRLNAGYYRLSKDYTLTSSMSLYGNVTLDLNGHVLKGNGNSSVIKTGNHTLSIYDSNPTAAHSPAITYMDSITKTWHTVLGGVITGGVANNYGGGGIFVDEGGTLNLHAGSICGNRATDNIGIASSYARGGGVSVYKGTFNMYGGTVCGNKSEKIVTSDKESDTGSGGGICVCQGSFNMTGGSVTGNVAEGKHSLTEDKGGRGGGVHLVSTSTNISGGAEISYNLAVNRKQSGSGHAGNGGGISASGGSLTIKAASVHYNKTYSEGGGLYFDGACNITLGGDSETETCSITYNEGGFETNGGGGMGVSLQSKSYNLTLNHCLIANNTANGRGGGIYISHGNIVMNEGAVIENNLCYSEFAAGGSGGGLYVSGSIIDNEYTVSGHFKGGEIRFNKTTESDKITISGSGGGAYIHDMDFELDGTSFHDNIASSGGGMLLSATALTFVSGTIADNKASSRGGGLYISANSTCTMTGGSIQDNVSENYGGGVYVNQTTFDMEGGIITNNTARYGGGVYNLTNSVFTMSGGSITSNTASNDGGGIDNTNATTKIFGGEVSGNLLSSTSGKGVGIYQDGIFYVSANPVFNAADDVYLTANHYITKDGTISVASPIHVTVADIKRGRDVVVSMDDATDDATGQVINGDLAHFVVNGANRRTYALFYTPDGLGDDVLGTYREKPSNVLELEITWVQAVTSKPSSYSQSSKVITISGKEGLAWLISVVNGYNRQTAKDLSGYTINLTADVDMSEYPWVAIGTAEHPFKGTFDAQGHSITGLYNLFSTSPILDIGVPGLFGVVDGGTVKNTFVLGSDFHAYTNPVSYVGIIADTLINSAVLHSSESAGQLTAMAGSIVAMGGIAGLVDNASVHSSMSMATLNGYNMGGAVGEIRNGGSLKNSFTHALYTSTNDAAGLAYKNAGAIDNCYVRVRSGNTLGNMFVTEGSGTVNNVYYPDGQTSSAGTAYTPTVTPYYYKHADNLADNAPLLQQLNANRGTGAEWMRTSAGTGNSRGTNSSLNDDYPVLKLEDFNSLASRDGIVLRYGDINDMLSKFNASGDAIDLYRSKEGVNSNSSSSANLYINEDVALTLNGTLNAFVGITSDNSAGTNGANPNGLTANGLTDAIDWHMFSTPLANAPLGVNYAGNTTQYNHWNGDVLPHFSFYSESEHDGYFPSKTYGTNEDYYEDWDFYCFYEPDYHWINFKRNTPSHWHEDAPHDHIEYTNEENLTQGKGYLVSTKKETYLQSYGSLNSGNVTIPVAKGAEHCTGYNLLGNPYQSYLDFKAFAEVNSGTGKIWNDVNKASYILMDEDNGGYVTYAYDQTWTETSAPRYINMHQGFFVVADNACTAQFTPAMCSVEHGGSGFRGDDEEPAYPLVTLCLNETNGNKSYVTVELDRPSKGGALLASDLHIGTGMLYAHYDNEDYSVIFAQPGTTSMPVWFESLADAQYTLSWNTQNGTFSNLHLIDNLTGVDIDMNACSEYRFSASTKDYKSRFKLMFTYTDVEENIDADHAETFAFMMGGNLVVNGEGRLEVIDLNGRIVSTTELNGTQNTVALPNASQGLYMLRLTSGNGVRVQKIVVR